MDVILVRHAIAEERDPARWTHDALRPLTAFGRERFAPAARGLGALVGHVDHVLASPYVRTWETARILSDQADWPEPEACAALAAHASVDEAIAALRAYRADERMVGAGHDDTIVCVGHEPNLSLLAQRLLRPADADAVGWFKKGGAARIRFRGGLDEGHGKLRWAHTPKQLRKLG